MRRLAIIVDLDNTLCDTRHREHIVSGGSPHDWDSYSLACGNDACIEWVADVVRGWKMMNPDGVVIILSGRNTSAMQITRGWLNDRHVPGDELILRKPEETGPNPEYKAAHAQRLLEFYDIQFVIDDHPGVLQHFALLGIPGLWVGRPESPHFPSLLNKDGAVHTLELAYSDVGDD